MTQLKQTALITGASRGFGLALACELAQKGWNLVIDARGADALNAARAELSQLAEVIAVAGSIDSADHRRELRQAAQRFGQLDVIVNNAGILGPSPQPNLLDYPLDVLENVYRVNVIAQLGVIQAVRDLLRDDARIFNISSDAGAEAYEGWGGYGSSKAALEHLSAVLAAENPQWRVYEIDPGDMRTQMHQDAFPGEDISDRPLAAESVPGFIEILEGDYASGRYAVQNLHPPAESAVSELRLVLAADRYDEAVRFYRDGMGLPVAGGWDDPNGRGTVLAAGQATIEIIDGPQAVRLEKVEAENGSPPPVRLAFQVPDLEGTGANISKQGAAAVREAITTTWGHRSRRYIGPEQLPITLFRDAHESENNGAS